MWLSDSSTCVAWNPLKFINNWVRHAMMELWTWKMCVRGYDSSKKAEYRVKINQRSLGHALADLKTWLREWNKWLCKTAAWLWNRWLPMPAYPLDLWTPSCMVTWKCGKFLQDGFRECWPMKTRLNTLQCVRQCYHVTTVMNSAFFSSTVTIDETWMPMFNPETKWQSAQWKHTDLPPPKKFRVTTSAEKTMVAMFWDSKGVILTHCIPKSTTVMGETHEDVLRKKFLPALREKRPKRLQLCSFITTMLLLIGQLVFTSFSTTTTLTLFLMLCTHLNTHQAIFGCF